MKSNIAFSIIIPTYNRASALKRCIDSVLNQTVRPKEILIIDDGSLDNTKDVVEAYSDETIIYIRKENGERGAARNTGILKASGDYITFLDSDDLLYKDYFEKALSFILHNDYPEIFNLGYNITEATTGRVIKVINDFRPSVNLLLPEGNVLSCHAVFMKSDICRKNLFIEDRNLAGLEDWEYWLRLSSKYNFKSCNVIASTMIQHPERSVVNYKMEDLINKGNLLIQYVFSNPGFHEQYGKYKRIFKASVYSYISLHLILSGRFRMHALKYLLISIYYNPFIIKKRRFFAILKLLFKSLWLKKI
ncbi:MAG: glycosyltransferase family 2 protein [Cytophagaceae bacterium]